MTKKEKELLQILNLTPLKLKSKKNRIGYFKCSREYGYNSVVFYDSSIQKIGSIREMGALCSVQIYECINVFHNYDYTSNSYPNRTVQNDLFILILKTYLTNKAHNCIIFHNPDKTKEYNIAIKVGFKPIAVLNSSYGKNKVQILVLPYVKCEGNGKIMEYTNIPIDIKANIKLLNLFNVEK